MRRRILLVALSAVVLAVLLLGVPLALAIRSNVTSQKRGELERAALQAAVAVSPSYQRGDPVELPAAGSSIDVALYDVTGRRVAGTGPADLEAALLKARHGTVAEAATGREFLQAVPVSVGERVIGVVRAASTRSTVRAAIARDLIGLGALALIALAGAGTFAYWQARRLSLPMLALAKAATDLGAGDFSVTPPVTGVAEIDQTGNALAATARRLSDQIARERAFAAQAPHQLRTPLTRLRLELETGLEGDHEMLKDSVRDALATADHLSQTIDDVLQLARSHHVSATEFDVEDLLVECVEQWRGVFATADRPLRLDVESPSEAAASRVAVRQVLQVLIDNAYRHGEGTVTLTARESGDAVAIDVADRGTTPVSWPDPTASAGRLGLAMARDLAAKQDGRLLLANEPDGTRFTLLVPRRSDPQSNSTRSNSPL